MLNNLFGIKKFGLIVLLLMGCTGKKIDKGNMMTLLDIGFNGSGRICIELHYIEIEYQGDQRLTFLVIKDDKNNEISRHNITNIGN